MAARSAEEIFQGIGEKFAGLYKDRDKLKAEVKELREKLLQVAELTLKSAHPLYVTLLEVQLQALGKEDLIEVAKVTAEKLMHSEADQD